MIFEKSCGAIIIRKKSNNSNTLTFETLLIQMLGGHWSYPKGHVENNETEVETAIREIKEETNLEVAIDTRFREITTYSPKPNVIKDVVFFIAYNKNNDVIIQESEILNYKWAPIEEAFNIVTYEEDKKILRKALRFLENQF